jgi:hypothetical protein
MGIFWIHSSGWLHGDRLQPINQHFDPDQIANIPRCGLGSEKVGKIIIAHGMVSRNTDN